MSHIQIRIDEKDKREARKVFDKLGLDMSSAIKLFLRQTTIRKALPFLVTTEDHLSIEEEAKLLDTSLVNKKREVAKDKAVPAIFKAFLWSYDFDKLDLEKDKERIIFNVLNLGSKEATDLLFKIYSKQDIKNVIKHPRPGEWHKKSLNYWSLVFNVQVKNVLRYSR